MSARTIAIIGASRDRSKFGNQAVRAFAAQGWTVYPIHPRETEIEGLPVVASVEHLPVRPDLVSIYLPPAVTLSVLEGIARRGCNELWLNPGAESDEVVARAEQLGLNVIQACSLVGHGLSPHHP